MRRITIFALILLTAFGSLASLQIYSDETEAYYRTSYRVINIHRHGAQPSEEAFKAELEVLDRTGFDASDFGKISEFQCRVRCSIKNARASESASRARLLRVSLLRLRGR